jgi:hypothetical protein
MGIKKSYLRAQINETQKTAAIHPRQIGKIKK